MISRSPSVSRESPNQSTDLSLSKTWPLPSVMFRGKTSLISRSRGRGRYPSPVSPSRGCKAARFCIVFTAVRAPNFQKNINFLLPTKSAIQIERHTAGNRNGRGPPFRLITHANRLYNFFRTNTTHTKMALKTRRANEKKCGNSIVSLFSGTRPLALAASRIPGIFLFTRFSSFSLMLVLHFRFQTKQCLHLLGTDGEKKERNKKSAQKIVTFSFYFFVFCFLRSFYTTCANDHRMPLCLFTCYLLILDLRCSSQRFKKIMLFNPCENVVNVGRQKKTELSVTIIFGHWGSA